MSDKNDESDKKDAVGIGVNLSSQLIAACLTMIAVVGAFITFALDKRNLSIPYHIITALSFICLVSSIFYGGKGINLARVNGFDGNWDITLTKKAFNSQAGLAFLGILFFCFSIFIGTEKSDEQKSSMVKLGLQISKLEVENKFLRTRVDATEKKYFVLKSAIDSLSTIKHKSFSRSSCKQKVKNKS